MFNNQVWHRGRPNFSERTRYITQISYASYLVGHKFFPFMVGDRKTTSFD